MTRPRLILLASAGSAALLLGALAFQHLGGLAPCKLCIWQRWPHGAAILAGLLALALPRLTVLPLLGALAALATSGVGLYHTGVEQHWWLGPTTCTSGSVGGLTADEFYKHLMNAPMVRCDDIAWQMFGLSMASWNMVISLALAVLWLMAWRSRT